MVLGAVPHRLDGHSLSAACESGLLLPGNHSHGQQDVAFSVPVSPLFHTVLLSPCICVTSKGECNF